MNENDAKTRKSSLVDYSKVSSRPEVQRQPSNSLPAAANASTRPSTATPPVISAQMDAVMRLMTGREERTIAEKLADSNRPTWEQYKKDNHDKLNLDTLDQKQMDDYRKQLDEERDRRMAGLPARGESNKKHAKKKKHHKKKRRRTHDNDDDSNDETSDSLKSDSSDDNEHRRRRKHKKHRKHHEKKSRHHRSRRDNENDSSDDNDESDEQEKLKKKKEIDKHNKTVDYNTDSNGENIRLSNLNATNDDKIE